MSASTRAEFPPWDWREIAVVGRSNVGKSSLINALVGNKSLARTSKTPGRTQSVNFFTWGESLILVDLPGYGYARISRQKAVRIGILTRDYLEKRANLVTLALLVDARRGPEQEEFELADLMRRRSIETIVAGAKCDKLKRSERTAAVAKLEQLATRVLLCSAPTGEGIADLRRLFFDLAQKSKDHFLTSSPRDRTRS